MLLSTIVKVMQEASGNHHLPSPVSPRTEAQRCILCLYALGVHIRAQCQEHAYNTDCLQGSKHDPEPVHRPISASANRVGVAVAIQNMP